HGGILYSRGRKDLLSTIAKNIEYSKTTVHDTLKRYAETGSTVPKKRPAKRKNQKVFVSILHCALRKCGLRSCVAYHKPLISASNKQNVVWSDESVLKQFSQNHNTQVWHTLTEEFDESCLVPTIKHSPGRSIIPICDRMNGEAYVNLLRRHAIPAVYQL
ncbi:3488_t:CDS:2, partial [Racocetra persica]